ncbi:acetyltransferase [Fictibacillus phosphorivorans]|uniref:Acetyltransferase n=1 Tax=Fictibacillus phosphorivorans TaxID=1221500 RepID=A0A163PYY6_9BACL|nr:GNAT family N-acetyltransferase [Fictibacillus phosphorivorans]KZE64335.1 acetyltransferase [Fictibacillus phosphorivorans]
MSVKDSLLKKAAIQEKDIISNLMQFYFYDFSEFIDMNVGNAGLYSGYPYLDQYWEEDGRYPYLIESEGKYAGFVLVREVVEEGQKYWSIAEFFIMKKFRRTGLGQRVAHQVFDSHKGNWEVGQIEKNKPAQIFWRKVIGNYTNGQFEEKTEEGMILQVFCNK